MVIPKVILKKILFANQKILLNLQTTVIFWNMEQKVIFGKRLKCAREMKGISMAELSDLMSGIVTRQAIYKYEAGIMLPDSSVLIKLSQILGVSIDYLFRPFNVALSGIEFRKKAKMSVKDRKSIEQSVIDTVERYFEIEDIISVDHNPELLKFDKIISSKNDVIDLVNTIRSEWGLGKDGITDVIGLLESKRIKIIEIDATDSFDGLSGIANDSIVIVLNKNISSTERKRFTALHELGHLVMHFSPDINEDEKEKLCHLFASEFLIPTDSFMSIVGDISKGAINLIGFADIQRTYGISIDALIKKAYDSELIAGNKYKNYFISKNRNPIFKKYVEESRIALEFPQRFNSMVFGAYSKNLISASKAASLLNTTINEVIEKAIFV